jgi:hypothetical protein
MGLLDDLTPPEKSQRCGLGKTIDTLDENDRTILEAALSDTRCTHRALWDAIKQRGIPVSRETLTLHRTGRCQCLKI